MERIKDLFSSHEDWLMERVLGYAKRQGYSEYSGTLLEDWRISIAGLTDALLSTVDASGNTCLEFTPDDTFSDDPISTFAVEEARLRRESGISLAMFMGLLKYYRQAYADCVLEYSDEVDLEQYRKFVARSFDRLEIALCVDWAKVGDQARLAELQASNRSMTNEKNKFLSLFESLTSPVFLLDSEFNIETMNLAAAEFLGLAGEPGELHYARRQSADGPEKPAKKVPLGDVVPWLSEAVNESCSMDEGYRACRLDVSASTALGPKHYNVSISNMADVSDKFTGFIVSLDDITARIEMEKQMARERNRATHYLDVVGSIVVVLDASGSITMINRTGCRTLDYTEQELLGQNWTDLIVPPEQSDEVREYLARIFADEIEIDDEHTNYVSPKEGSDRLIAWKNRLLRNDEGIPIGILSSGDDITEQREIEDALAEKELWLRNTFVALGEAVLIMTPERIVIDANPAAESMFQMANEEFDGKSAEALHVDHDHYVEFGERIQTAFAKGEAARFEFSMRRKNGQVFPTEHSVSLIIGDDGSPLGIVSAIRDTSNRKKAELVIRQSEEKFRRIFETIEEGYIVVDLDGVMQMVNPATCSILGYSESELVGKSMSMLYSVSEEQEKLQSSILANESVRGYNMTLKRKDGFAIVVETNAHLVRDENGVPIGREGTFRDITQRIEAENVLRDREKQYRAFFENNHAIMLLVDPKTGKIVDANPAASAFYGYSVEKMCEMVISDISSQTEEEIFREMFQARKEKRVYFIFKHRLANGDTRDVEVYSGPIMVQGNQLLYSVIHDVTSRIKLEREMKLLATIDTLTGANNRHQFFSRSDTEFKRAKRYGHQLSVLMLDIDYFKSINDTHGHQAGDVVLKALSAMAITTLRETDVFGRIGGEEFAATLPETGLREAVQVAERLREALAKLMVRAKDVEVTFTVSIGVTLALKEDQNIEEIMNRADEALYKAKRMGRNRVEKS